MLPSFPKPDNQIITVFKPQTTTNEAKIPDEINYFYTCFFFRYKKSTKLMPLIVV